MDLVNFSRGTMKFGAFSPVFAGSYLKKYLRYLYENFSIIPLDRDIQRNTVDDNASFCMYEII